MTEGSNPKAPWTEDLPRLSVHLLLTTLLASAAEVGGVGAALVLLDLDAFLTPPFLAVAAVTYLITSGIAGFLQVVMLRPVHRVFKDSLAAAPPPDSAVTKALSALERYPDWTAATRVLIWLVVVGTAVLIGGRLEDIPTRTGLAALGIAPLTAFGTAVLWWLWLDTTLTTFRQRLRLQTPVLSKRRLVGRLVWSTLACGSIGMAGLFVFTLLFVDPDPRAAHLLSFYLLPVFLLLVLLWILLVRRLTRPLENHLEARQDPGEESAVIAFRRAQNLPYLLAICQILLWLGGGLLVCLGGVWIFGLAPESAGLIFIAATITSLAVVLYGALWHRRLLQSLLELLGQRHASILHPIRSPISVRLKMLGGFGILTLFACGTAIFWSFVQYRNLATKFIEQQAHTQLDFVLDRLMTLEKIHPHLRPQVVTGLLRERAAGSEAIYYYLPRSGRIRSFTGGGDKCPPLPFSARTKMRRDRRGSLALSQHNLAGAHARIRLKSGDYGAVAVLYPDYLGRGPGLAKQIKILLFFFIFLLLVSGGIVVLMVEDLTSPLKGLEQRVDEMARGDLARPVPAGYELDEVGRLSVAFEEMRRSLDEKLSTIQKLNLGLERKVEARTADLAKANQELREALDSLTRTQDQLVRSEKLASIGQLVAGIAHELNNPINAVVNSVRPLRTATEEFLKTLDGRAPDSKQACELAEEIQQILRVITSGTDRTKRIVSALGSYARRDAQKTVHTDINTALEDALQITAHLTTGKKIIRKWGQNVFVRGWPGQLEQVFVNLIANAAQAVDSTEGGKHTEGRIVVETERTAEAVRISITDNGPGIPEETQNKIFDPFFTTKDVGAGTGLGLSISHDIVVRHGGSIELDSTLGQGTTFTVILPTEKGPDGQASSINGSQRHHSVN
jgi:signal transduction histidine kinase